MATMNRPLTIPALQEWTSESGSYTFTSHTRLVIPANEVTSLEKTAQTFADDLFQLTTFTIPIVSTEQPQAGDIVLTLSAEDHSIGKEGYILEVRDLITVRANRTHGVFYGTRTLLQLLKQNHTIAAGTTKDWPNYLERSLMVDNGRKYFTITWLKNHIRDLAYLKYNYFHLHISDNHGFRLESERHPEIMSPQHYTKAEIRDLIDFANQYHITIVPEIDMPGHMDTILQHHPDLQLVSSTGVHKPGDIDLGKEESYALMRDILEEFIPLFTGPYWHIGADEYLMNDDYANYPQLLEYAHKHYGPQAVDKDTYLGFVNWVNDIVKAHGKTTRAWNDGLYGGTIAVDNDIIYEHWYNSKITPQELLDRNLLVMNGNADHLYYVLAHYWKRYEPNAIYDTFEQHIFQNQSEVTPNHPNLLGSKLHIWCDFPDLETEDQIASGIEYWLRTLSQKNWGSPKLFPTYPEFSPLIPLIGHAPGYISPK